MISALKLGILAAASLIAACAARSAIPDQPIGWSLTASPSQLARGEVQLSFEARTGRDDRSRTSHSRTFALSEFEGLSSADLQSGGTRPIRFHYVQPAGRLDCNGEARFRAGAGTCGLTANQRFADALALRGIGRANDRELFNLTMSGVDLAVLDELARHGYPKPDIDGIVSLGIFKVTPGYVRELAASGYRLRTIGDLVQFKVFKVEPTYIQELRKLGYANLPVEDLVQFKIFRITPDYIRELDELGYAGIPTKKLVELRIHGVTTEYIRGFAQAGVGRPGIDQLTRMRMAGVRPPRSSEPR
ncbi:MAG TPA: hypothetical protein VEZ48_01610 [Sphingomonadaceae bacterium]|nr:hypothetical protein [Sphingomonadaceae bacterium]